MHLLPSIASALPRPAERGAAAGSSPTFSTGPKQGTSGLVQRFQSLMMGLSLAETVRPSVLPCPISVAPFMAFCSYQFYSHCEAVSSLLC